MTSDDIDDKATRVRHIRVAGYTWAAYGRVCASLGTNRTADILTHIRRMINRHGTEADINDLVRGDAQLAERRSRMSPGASPGVRRKKPAEES